MDEVIETRNVHKTYQDDGVPVHAVKGVDLTIRKSEFTSLVGPSGSGKTTLLNLIAGLDTPTEGEVYLEGRAIGSMSGKELSDLRRDRIGFIFQAFNLIPVLTAAENVEYVMLLQGIDERRRRRRVEDILTQVGLEDYIDTLPSKLSGGQQQRVAVARAMAAEPALVIADEPTANLDSNTSGELLDMMRGLNRETGMTFLFSTHDRIVMERATRVVTLTDGRISDDHRKDV